MVDFPRPYAIAKRSLDVGGSLLLLVGLAPLFCAVALWVWWDAGRPILFTQRRAGRRGRRFRLFKFRTLSTTPDDPSRAAACVTRSGAVLRRWALDELPQLWNVLRGEMSLVGPRPPLPDDLDHYGPRDRLRLAVRPGLTGWAQIHGRNALSWPERIDHDVWYVRNRSVRLDLRILARTPAVLVRGRGVYGPEARNPSFPSSRSGYG
jgi:lipopolysaccharide/colanic/teichoic acid biosynthesis glycosyltransferase